MTSDIATPSALHHYVFRCHIGQECYAEPAGKLFQAIVHGLWKGRKTSETGSPGSRPSIREVAIAGRKTLRVTSTWPLESRDIEAIDGACRDYQDALVVIGEAQISSCVDLASGPDKTAVVMFTLGDSTAQMEMTPREHVAEVGRPGATRTVHITNTFQFQPDKGVGANEIVVAFNKAQAVKPAQEGSLEALFNEAAQAGLFHGLADSGRPAWSADATPKQKLMEVLRWAAEDRAATHKRDIGCLEVDRAGKITDLRDR